ncbi:MAG TPA: hypothetical protein VHZ29_12865 [Rhizomicrobium sp.]|nr:hypothetical protein [Rhizomicrobium sp.]
MKPLAIARRFLAKLAGRPAERRKSNPNEPSGRLLQRARSIAFIVSVPADERGQDWPGEAVARGAALDVLPLFQPYLRADGKVMSFLFTPPRDAYDCIVVNRSVRLFEHSWSYAFLDRLNALLSKRGTIFIPRRLDAAQRLSDQRLSELFGRGPSAAAPRYLAFRKAANGLKRPPDAALSTLDAYWPLMDSLIHGSFDARLGEVIRSLGVARAVERTLPDAGKFLTLLQSQSYRTNSAATKAAMIQFIASVYFPQPRDLRLADLGAGTALNSLELLLNPSGVSHLTLVEPWQDHYWDIAAVYDRLGDRVRGKVTLAGRTVETYSATPVDIAMVCSVFAVMPVKQREPFVQSAWNAVAPGGILAVLENMRDEDPVRGGSFNATRFTPHEIDDFLGRFAPIRYFRSDAMTELRSEDVGNKGVFRVLQKPS